MKEGDGVSGQIKLRVRTRKDAEIKSKTVQGVAKKKLKDAVHNDHIDVAWLCPFCYMKTHRATIYLGKIKKVR